MNEGLFVLLIIVALVWWSMRSKKRRRSRNNTYYNDQYYNRGADTDRDNDGIPDSQDSDSGGSDDD
ncbi:hypothetical protein SAMN02745704_00224 [Paucidesulfovibrio gracilis DSM 16080]|uniref:Uncharacterized protein n=1 Tax=Paucidesulfovibrio gracilis DSM 16080 TaxID=1121449 RepID=A0A1T4W3P9_9BACT|nr:hypothetical protein [Paucidesulfovibrio gracilis]SKA71862.1 hypothetical protein SAMN02745704_00224 [Paucidesulfovibrio gracilis DSM 16080]